MGLYRLMLVDDEEDVRESIARKVDWHALGYELAGAASNGEEALELATQLHVDVVMTDIKMPFMDGLTLCEKLKQSYQNIKVVLYSGFDEFELAREAVHLEAEEFLLKPIAAKDIENVFRKIKQNLDKEIDERTNLQKLDEYYRKSLPLMREQLLVGLLDGKLTEKQAQEMAAFYEMELSAPFYCVGLLDAGKDTPAMLRLSLLGLAGDYLDKFFRCHTLMYLNKIVVIAWLNDAEGIKDFVYHLNQVCQMGARMLNLEVNAGVGHAFAQVTQIALSFEEAKTAYDYRILNEERGMAFYIQDVEPDHTVPYYPESQAISQVIHEIKFGTADSLQISVESFVAELRGENKLTIKQYQLALMEIVTELMKLMRANRLDPEEIAPGNQSVWEQMERVQSLTELSAWLEQLCSSIFRMIRKKRTSSANLITEKAKSFVEEHYSDSDLCVEQLCNHLNVSATYLSVMFKKELGMSFVSYLTKVRLRHAVELLNTTDDKSYIIAEKVGYTEPNYFSYVFKKEYGVSPSRYRNNEAF